MTAAAVLDPGQIQGLRCIVAFVHFVDMLDPRGFFFFFFLLLLLLLSSSGSPVSSQVVPMILFGAHLHASYDVATAQQTHHNVNPQQSCLQVVFAIGLPVPEKWPATSNSKSSPIATWCPGSCRNERRIIPGVDYHISIPVPSRRFLGLRRIIPIAIAIDQHDKSHKPLRILPNLQPSLAPFPIFPYFP